MNKNTKKCILFGIITFLSLPHSILAQGKPINSLFYPSTVYSNSDGGAVGPNALNSIYNPIIRLIFVIAGTIVMVNMLYGGYQFISGAGNPEKTRAGKNAITISFAGLALLLSIYWIVQIVETITGLNIINGGGL